jgi:hypothetical protein
MYQLPISLWNLALEVHTGHIFTFLGTVGSFLYIFLMAIRISATPSTFLKISFIFILQKVP